MRYCFHQDLEAYEVLQKQEEEQKQKDIANDPEVSSQMEREAYGIDVYDKRYYPSKVKAVEAARSIIRLIKTKLKEQADSATRKEALYEGLAERAITKLDDPQKAEEDDSIGRWVFDIGMVEEMARGPDEWTYDAEIAKAEEEAKAAEAAAAHQAEAWKSKRVVRGKGRGKTEAAADDKAGPAAAAEGDDSEAAATAVSSSSGPNEGNPQNNDAKETPVGSLDIFTAVDTPMLRSLIHKAAKREE